MASIVPTHIQKWYQEYEMAAQKAIKVDDKVIQTLTLWEEFIDCHRTSSLEECHMKMDNVRASLNTFERSIQQQEMHEQMLQCVSKQIYGNNIYEHEDEILRYNGFTSLRSDVIFTAWRRFGKTEAVAQFAATLLINVSEIDISIFSTASRASDSISKRIKTLVKEHFNVDKKVITQDNDESLILKYGPGDGRTLHAYPGSRDTYVLFFSCSCRLRQVSKYVIGLVWIAAVVVVAQSISVYKIIQYRDTETTQHTQHTAHRHTETHRESSPLHIIGIFFQTFT